MATKEHTSTGNQSDWRRLAYTSGVQMGIAINPDASVDDVTNLLSRKLSHLEAMLMTTYGEGGESFRGWDDTLQDNFMWSCAELAAECRAIFDTLSSKGGGA